MTAILLDNVTKKLRNKKGVTRVFTRLNAAFPAGQSVGILGTKGAGKSTLIRMLGGSVLPDSGSIRRRGFVSPPIASSQAYHASLSGRENVHFVARIHGFDGAAAVAFVEKFAKLGPSFDHPISSYNRERRARFLFAAAYAFPFDIYIADEAIFGGSGDFRERCAEIVQERRKHASFVFSTRSPQMLRRFADIGAVLHDGKLELYDDIGDAIRAFLAVNDGPTDASGAPLETAESEDDFDLG